MTILQTYISAVAGVLTLLSVVLLTVFVFSILIDAKWRGKVYAFVYDNIVSLLFAVSLSAVVGSLGYSEIVHFPPCDLCWIQRIFIYPQAVLTLTALIKGKSKMIVDYLLPLSIIGGAVALYQSLIQWGFFNSSIVKCLSVGGECAKVYVNEFGFITIPFMSLMVFAYSITLIVVYYKAKVIHG